MKPKNFINSSEINLTINDNHSTSGNEALSNQSAQTGGKINKTCEQPINSTAPTIKGLDDNNISNKNEESLNAPDEFILTTTINKFCEKKINMKDTILMLSEIYEKDGCQNFVHKANGFFSGSKTIKSCVLFVLFQKNPELLKMGFKDFIKATGLQEDAISDQTLLNNRNAYKILQSINNLELRKTLLDCGVSVIAKFASLLDYKNLEELICECAKQGKLTRIKVARFVAKNMDNNTRKTSSKSKTELLSCPNNCKISGIIEGEEEETFPNRFGNSEDTSDDILSSKEISVLSAEVIQDEIPDEKKMLILVLNKDNEIDENKTTDVVNPFKSSKNLENILVI